MLENSIESSRKEGLERMKMEDRELVIPTNLPHLGGRKLNWYDLPNEALARSRAQIVGVAKSQRREPFERQIRVVGTGRCGSTWLSRALVAAGFDIPHECVGEHGTVSQFFHTDHFWYPFIPWATNHPGRKAHVGERLSDFTFRRTVHLVRHPLETEASMRSIYPQLFFYWLQDIGLLGVPYDHKPAFMRNLYAWECVVELCERISHNTFTLPYVTTEDGWATFLKFARLKTTPMPEVKPTNKSSGFKKHEPVDWKEVDKHDPDLCARLRGWAKKLGLE